LTVAAAPALRRNIGVMALPRLRPRAGLPVDIAHAALWFASEESTFLNGHALIVGGGPLCSKELATTLVPGGSQWRARLSPSERKPDQPPTRMSTSACERWTVTWSIAAERTAGRSDPLSTRAVHARLAWATLVKSGEGSSEIKGIVFACAA
jgi:hypothetical protein